MTTPIRVLLAVTVVLLVPAARAAASPSVWSGNAPHPEWSIAGNWSGDAAPSTAEPASLEFPRLPSCAGTCYIGENDLTGLEAQSIAVDDGDEYLLAGNPIRLGAGGLSASPAAGSSGPAGDLLALPLTLTASQNWTVVGRGSGAIGENGVAVFGSVKGSDSDALDIQIGAEAAVFMENETEAGPVTIAGADASKAGIFNGYAALGGDANFTDEEPVNLKHIFVIADGVVGALHADHAGLSVGAAAEPAEGVAADSATFEEASEVGFEIAGPGEVAGKDYSVLEALGPIELNGATLHVTVWPPNTKAGTPCPSLRAGQTYTFISTEAHISGSFVNAPEGGPEILVSFAAKCHLASRPMRISYHRAGAVETVTGTIEAAVLESQEAKEHQEAKERQEAHEREEQNTREGEEAQRRREAEATLHLEEAARKHLEEETVAAARKHTEEEAAARKRTEEAAAKSGVLGVKESSKPTRAQLLHKALKACRREPKHKRARCDAAAQRRYGTRKARGKKG